MPTYQVTHSQISDTAKEMLSQPHLNIYPPRLRFLSLEILSPLLHSNPLSSVSFLFPSSPLFCLFMYLFCEAGGFIPWGNVWRSEDNFWDSVCSFIMWVTGSNSDHQAWRQSPYPQSHLVPPPSSHFFLLIPVHSPQRLYSESVLTTMLQVAGKVQEVLKVLTLRLLLIQTLLFPLMSSFLGLHF